MSWGFILLFYIAQFVATIILFFIFFRLRCSVDFSLLSNIRFASWVNMFSWYRWCYYHGTYMCIRPLFYETQHAGFTFLDVTTLPLFLKKRIKFYELRNYFSFLLHCAVCYNHYPVLNILSSSLFTWFFTVIKLYGFYRFLPKKIFQ